MKEILNKLGLDPKATEADVVSAIDAIVKKAEQVGESQAITASEKTLQKAEAFFKQNPKATSVFITGDNNLFIVQQQTKAMAFAAKNKTALYLATPSEKGVTLKQQ